MKYADRPTIERIATDACQRLGIPVPTLTLAPLTYRRLWWRGKFYSDRGEVFIFDHDGIGWSIEALLHELAHHLAHARGYCSWKRHGAAFRLALAVINRTVGTQP